MGQSLSSFRPQLPINGSIMVIPASLGAKSCGESMLSIPWLVLAARRSRLGGLCGQASKLPGKLSCHDGIVNPSCEPWNLHQEFLVRVSWFPTASRSILCFLALLPTPWKPLISLVDNEPFSDPPTSLNSSLLPQKPCTRLVPLSDARGCLEILTPAGGGAGGRSGSLFFCMGVDFFFFLRTDFVF